MSPVSSTPSTSNWVTTWRTRSKPAGFRCRSETCRSVTTSGSVATGSGSVEMVAYSELTLPTMSSSEAR
jgi:hypothetical protein